MSAILVLVLVEQEKAIVMVHLDIIQVHQAMVVVVAVVLCVIMLLRGVVMMLDLTTIFQLIMVAMIELIRMIYDQIQGITMTIDEIMFMVPNMIHQVMDVVAVANQ
jgi:hypothetical protein